MNRFQSLATVVVAVLVSMSGCSSFKSLIVHRNADDSLSKQCCPKNAHGVPVTLKVPSHVEVAIVETYFITPKKTDNPDNESGPSIQTLSPNNGTNRILNVEKSLEYTEKVFTVDFARPLAGNLTLGDKSDAGLQFDAEQYFQSIQGTVEDNTIDSVTRILGGTAPEMGETMRAFPEELKANAIYTRLTRVVAFQRFDISEQNWEGEMQAFIDKHLGQCNPPCESGCVECENAVISTHLPYESP